MVKIKTKVLLPLIVGEKSYGYGDEVTLEEDVAYHYANNGVVEFSSKKAFNDLDAKIKKAKEEKIAEEEQKEKELEKALYEKELREEKATLENRIAEINEILGEGGE